MKINFLGDIGIFRKYELLNIDPFSQIDLPESDLNIGNFEFIIPKKRTKFYYDVQDAYSCSYDYLKKLKINKFHGFGFANNHSLDYGLEGANDTINFIRDAGLSAFGFSNDPSYTLGNFNCDGIHIGIIACVKNGRWSKEKNGFGPDSYDVSQIINLIRENSKKYDHLVIYPHWGTELISVPDPADTRNAKAFIDAGASAVIGHHPHVPQGIEQYKNGIIAYSLGSFIYVHEDELGYSDRDIKRHISMCINVELTKSVLANYTCYYYRYNPSRKIPEMVASESLQKLILFLNNNIYNQKLRNQEISKTLIIRELHSFFERFKASPLKALVSYTRHFLSFVLRRIFKK